MFSTGIENSVPTLDGGRTRVDEMESCGFYERWREDFALVQEIGIQFLRYGPPIHTSWLAPGKYDWEFSDITFAELKRLGIVPIVDLCHFGVPDWIGNFQNGDFPQLFEAYSRDFAARFPWVQLYTPVNEMFICAMFSAQYGWWNVSGVTFVGRLATYRYYNMDKIVGQALATYRRTFVDNMVSKSAWRMPEVTSAA